MNFQEVARLDFRAVVMFELILTFKRKFPSVQGLSNKTIKIHTPTKRVYKVIHGSNASKILNAGSN